MPKLDEMSDKLKYVVYKVLVVAIVVFVINVIFIFVIPAVFNSIYFSISIILFNAFVIIDKIFQPPLIYGKKDKTKEDLVKTFYLFLFLLLNPFLFTLPYLEYNHLLKALFPQALTLVFWVLGTFILIIGGIILCMSRFILGKEATLIIGIEKDHKLITKGPYHFVRHPIYTGSIFLFLGYTLSFTSIIGSVIILIVLLTLFYRRMALEEKLLVQNFGEEYREYMKNTKRLIPFIY